MKNHRLSVCCILLITSVVSIFCINCHKRQPTWLSDNKLIQLDSQEKAVTSMLCIAVWDMINQLAKVV